MSATPSTQKYGTIVTDRGRQIIAAAVATDTKVDIKYVALGDGNGAEYYPSVNQAALKNQVFQAEANSVDQDDQNQSWIVVQLYVPEHIGGWWVREVAVKTASGAVLAIGTVAPSYKPIMEEGSAAGTYYRIILEVSNATVVNLIVDPSTVMASKEDVERLINAHAKLTNVHGGTYEKTPSRLMLRNAKGQCQVADPEHDADATPKQWMEKKVDEKIGEYGKTVTATFDELMAGMIFPGVAVMFNGTFSGKNPINPTTGKPATKWHICDGTDGTPDLRDKFVIGASTTKAVGSTGGSEKHKHTGKGTGSVGATTLSTTQIPAHNHSVNTRGRAAVAEGKNEYDHWGGVVATTTGNAGGGQSHTHSASSLTLEVDEVETLPPYRAMAYIIRMA